MDIQIEPSWKAVLQEEFDKPYFNELLHFVKTEFSRGEPKCYPPARQIFAAFDQCPFDATRVVIIGQDPYHGSGQANGLSFSVADHVRIPPSLVNIFEEIRRDTGKPVPASGNLQRWARQGVLLLNATLTVREASPGSHQKRGWEIFTDAVIREVSARKKHVVFLLWGNFAQQKGKGIDASKHLVLRSGHPSPMSANQGKWFGNRHFSQANQYLAAHGLQQVDW